MKNFYLLLVILIFPLAGISQTINFSIQRGFFQTPFQLNLSTSIAGGSIRYTTDGSTPSPTNGTLYSGSISVNSTAVIRAIGYNGPTVTPITTHSYLFLDNVVQQPATISGWPNNSYALGSGTATAVHDYQMDPNVFALSGAQVRNATETTAPYALFGDVNGNYNSWIPGIGSYTLTGTPYATSSGGTAGLSSP